MGRHIGRLRSFLVGLCLISTTVAVCPNPWLFSDETNFYIDKNPCDGVYSPGCKFTIICNPGHVPTDGKWTNMKSDMVCGPDEKWRDGSGKLIDQSQGSPDVLSCKPACAYNFNLETSHFTITQSPSTLWNFTNPYDNDKPTFFIPPGESFKTTCAGDRIALYSLNRASNPTIATYTCNPDITKFNSRGYRNYVSSDANPESIEKNCWYYCPFDWSNKVGNLGVLHEQLPGRAPNGETSNSTCASGFVYPPGTEAATRGFQNLRCNAEDNTWTDLVTNNIVRQEPCILGGQPGECGKFDAQNVTIIESNCEETATGYKDPCKLTVICKDGMYPSNSDYLKRDNGSQTLLCQNGFWRDEEGSYANLMQCKSGCVKEIDRIDLKGFYNENSIKGELETVCINITYYKQPPPYHPYYCDDLTPVGDCTAACKTETPIPEGVIITNYTWVGNWEAPVSTVAKMINYLMSGHNVVYGCKEGYAYPPDSLPAQRGNRQEFSCKNTSYIDIDVGSWTKIVPCVPITGCPQLQPADNVIISNKSANCILDNGNYNNDCVMSYDCASGYYPNDTDYLDGDGQHLTCQRSANWYNEMKGETVNETLTCILGCVPLDWTTIIKRQNNLTVNIGVITIKDTANESHTCFDIFTLDIIYDLWNNTMKGKNKYFCETQHLNQSLVIGIARPDFGCFDSCAKLDTSVLPAGLKLIEEPPTFVYEENNGAIYVGENKTYVFQCEKGMNVYGKDPSYQQKLQCNGLTYTNLETGEIHPSMSAADLQPCAKSPVCHLRNDTNIDISTDCTQTNGTVDVGCTVNTTCKPGFYSVDILGINDNRQSRRCNITETNNATWITIDIGRPSPEMVCYPGNCTVPPGSENVEVSSSCEIINGQVTTNCTVTEECKNGLIPVDITGVVEGRRTSICNTTTSKNGTLIDIVIGQPLPPLTCGEKPTCQARPNTTSVVVTTDCRADNGRPLNVGCKMTEECVEGMYPINIKDTTTRSQTSVCNVTTNGTAIWIDIGVGDPSKPLECSAPCNTTTPPGTKLTHECVAVQGGLPVGCNATLSCEDDLVPINIDGRIQTNVTCDGKGHNATWIDISTGEAMRNTSCGCPPPKINNNTNINSTCYVPGVGGPPGCTLEPTCEPGSAPIFGSTRETTNRTLYCGKTTNGKNTWIEIAIGEPFAGSDCLKKCPNLTIPNAHITYDCPANNGGYPVNCTAKAVCNDGYVGYNIKYNYSSTVNVVCTNITSNNSTFIEISTGQPLEDFCNVKGCEPLNGTNVNFTTDCVLTGGVVPQNCSANTTCLPGTYLPIDINGKSSTDLSVYCDGTKNKNATWIDISTGEERNETECYPSCKFKEIPHTTFHTECIKESDDGYRVNCQVQLRCEKGYTGININYKYASIVNITCKSVDSKNSTFIEISTGLPLEDEICGPEPTEMPEIVCPPIDGPNDIVSSDCYLAGTGAARDCEANVTCKPGTYPVYVNGKERTTVTRVKCTEDPTTKKITWIDISTGDEFESKDCKNSCPFTPVNHTTATSDCILEDNGQYAVGCTVQLKCVADYSGINVNYQKSSTVNITCKNITSQNSTFIELEFTNKPVENEICGPADKCEAFNDTNTKIISDCYMSTGSVKGCHANVMCEPGTYPIYIGGNINTTMTVVCNKTSESNSTWVDVTTGEENKWRDCRPPCAPINIPNTKKTHVCQPIEGNSGNYTVGCSVKLECDQGYIPITTETVENGIIRANCTTKDNITSTWINIKTGQPVREDVCQPGCEELNPGPGVIQTGQSCQATTIYAAGCKKDFTCAEPNPNPTGPTTNTAECRISGGKGTWIDPATNQPYTPIACPPPKGCTPIHIDPSTTVTNKTCTPSNPPQSIHPENCIVDVDCLDGYHPTLQELVEKGEHNVECIKNGTTGGYEWFDRTVNAWWQRYTCTKGCLNVTLPTQKNTTTIGNKQCEFTTLPFGTGKYMCNQSDITSANCTDTCQKLIVNEPLKIVTYPPFILTQVVPIDGQYVVYCPDGWLWNGTTSSSKTFTCTQNGTYISDKPGDKATLVVINECVQPTEPPKNCTLELTQDQEIIYSSCDTESDDTYAEGCIVEVQCKNGTYPKSNETSQIRECKDENWVDPKTKEIVKEYLCGPDCKNSTEVRNNHNETSIIGNATVTCTIYTIEREMIKYICGNQSIDPTNPIVERNCTNTCKRIGLDVNMTNTQTIPDLIYDKVPLGGQTEVQCPPDTVFVETGSRTNWYTCMADGTYNGPNGTTGLIFVQNTCVNPGSVLPCPTLNNTNANVQSTCYIATSTGTLGCNANVTCIPNTFPVYINGKEELTTSVVCNKTTEGKNTWVDISTGDEFRGKQCLPPCNNMTIPHSKITYSCIGSLVNGRHQVGCTAVLQCDEGYFPITSEAGSNGIVTANCTSHSSDNSTFINIRTGQLVRGDVCQPNPGCTELDPGAGVIQTSSTCPTSTIYRSGCRKEFACAVENSNPAPGEKTTNTAVCKVENDIGTWIDPDTNQPYKPLNCPAPKGCTPIHIDPSTTITNITCTPSNPPQSIHPENCMVDVVCLANSYPTLERFQNLHEHKAECIKNGTGGYNWYDRTINEWWNAYTCTKGCLNKTLEVQKNTTTIDNKHCEFTNQPFGTGRYMCNQSDIISANCTDTCQKLIVNEPLRIVTYPTFILTQVVAVDGKYVVYCPDGWLWNGTTSSSRTFTCTKNGSYISDKPGDKATLVAVDECVKPTEYPTNCTLELTPDQEIVSSTCDTESDDTYAEGCIVEIRCKNGTFPKNNKGTQKQECKNEDWVEPGTGKPVSEYLCGPDCKNTTEIRNGTTTTEIVGNTTVTCTVYRIPRDMLDYICNKSVEINPTDPIVERVCTNTCKRIGLDVNMTNTRTIPDLIHDKVPLYGDTEVQCPPDTVFQETGSRTNWYKCMADGTYNGPNGTTGLTFVNNTCVDPGTLKPCPTLNNTNANVTSTCYIASSTGIVGCKADVVCIPNTYPVYINGKEELTTSVVCNKTADGKNTWVDISTGDEFPGKECQPPCDNLTDVPNAKITYSCTKLTDNGKHPVGCNVTLECVDGYVPITTELAENGRITGKCTAQNAQTSIWINIKTGQPVKKEDLCQPIGTTSTEAPVEKCKWRPNEPRVNMTYSGDSNDKCALLETFPPTLPAEPTGYTEVFENCVIKLYCFFSYQVPSGYGSMNKSILAVCNKTDENGGIWYEVETGLPIKKLNCVNWTEPTSPPPTVVCPELNLEPGVIETSQTCAKDSDYAIGCKKNLACAEPSPNPTGPTTNTAECKADGNIGRWVDPSTNQPYVQLDCPTPTGCTPITIDPSTKLTNKTCTPSNAPNSIHPENCIVDVECLDNYYPTEISWRTFDEHKAECIKNPSGKFEWFDRTINVWWKPYTCTEGCLNETLPTQSNTTTIGEPPKVCTFTTQPFRTGKYMCDRKEIRNASCQDTCPPLTVESPLIIAGQPERRELILGHLIPVNGRYVVYCPDGWLWTGINTTYKFFYCTANGTYISNDQTDEATIVVKDECFKPEDKRENCTLTVSPPLEIVSSSCDTDDETYADQCLVELKCKNGTHPRTGKSKQLLHCEHGKWIDLATNQTGVPYPCDENCVETEKVITYPKNETKIIGNTTVTCTRFTIDPGMYEYVCNKTNIDPADPVVKTECANTCERIGLDVNMTNTRTIPNLIHDKVPLYGDTEVQCPPGTVFQETGSRTNWYKCMADGTYNGPNGTTGLKFVKNTCVSTDLLKPCKPLNNTNAVVTSTCYTVTEGGVLGCKANVTCTPNTYPVYINGKMEISTDVVCNKTTTGNNSWIEISIGDEYPGKVCLPPCTNMTIPHSKITYACIGSLVNGRHQVGCTAVLQCDEGYFPITSEAGSNGIVTANCTSHSSDNSTFINIRTGQLVRGDVCQPNPGCTELDPGAGVIQTSSTCPTSTIYRSGCRKEFACAVENSNPAPGEKTTNTAVCKVENGVGSWVDPDTNQPYKPLNCPAPKGCTPIHIDPSTTITNITCTPSNPPQSIHPENCMVDVVCLANSYPTLEKFQNLHEHKAECIKNGTGSYNWYDRTINEWWNAYTCTKGCLNKTLEVQKNTTTIDNKHCEFTNQPFGTGRYMCNQSDIISANCTDTCQKLIVNEPLKIVTYPTFILTQVVPVDGKYVVYCPDGWLWNGTTSSSRTFTCTKNGSYISDKPGDKATLVAVDECVKPTEYPTNCTLELTPDQEIVSSTCDTESDDTYAEGCIVEIRCKNGTFPKNNKGTQKQECKNEDWVEPGTDKPVSEYLCGPDCKNMTEIRNGTTTTVIVGNTTVTCTVYRIPRDMLDYICNKSVEINPTDPIVERVCTNTCKRIGLDVNMTNTRTIPGLIYDKVPLHGDTEVQCPPDTVFIETGSRTNWYKCMADGTYNGPNGSTGLTFVVNTCVDPKTLVKCREIGPGPGVIQMRQSCAEASTYAIGCTKEYTCADGIPLPGSSGSGSNTTECREVNGKGTWVDPKTGLPYVQLNCPTPTGCTPIPIDASSSQITNITCTPSNGAIRIHPENCTVDVECKPGYYPTSRTLWSYYEHRAECIMDPSGKYNWYDRTVNAWWQIYTCTKGCLNETLPTQSNTTTIGTNPQQVCNYKTLPFGTGRYMCNLSDITEADCTNTCRQLNVNYPLTIVTYPELILTKVVPAGGQYVVYCPNGWIWKGTTSASKTFTCLQNGTYISDNKIVTEVVNDCEKPVTPEPVCKLELLEGQEIVYSTCDTSDSTYEDKCVVGLRCKNGTHPTNGKNGSEEIECSKGIWVKPGTTTPAQPYPCNSTCLVVSVIPSTKTNTTTVVGNTTVTCVISRIEREMIRHVCNETFIDPTNPVVEENCTNICDRIGLDVNMTNTRTRPYLVHDKVPLFGWTEVQCPPGTVFQETGNRSNWYLCLEDRTYLAPDGSRIIFVNNTCVDPNTVTPTPTPSTPPPGPPQPGCEDIKYDPSTTITNKTCVPFPGGIHPEWCIVDVKCKNGTYPEDTADRNRPEHKVQCQLHSNGTFGWVDLTVGGEWCPYKCNNGCMPVPPGITIKNTTIKQIGGITYVCEVETVVHQTGRYYCNVTDDVISSSCNNTCDPLIVKPPTEIIKEPTYIFGKLVPIGGTYEVSCPDSWFYNGTGLSVKNYTCTENGTYTDGDGNGGITEADDQCECVNGNCTLVVPENMVVEQVNCPIDDNIYAIGCQVKLRCKNGYRFADMSRKEWISHVYYRWQCTLRDDQYIWFDTDNDETAGNDTCVEDKDCVDTSELKQTCYSVKETHNGKETECQYCKYDTALDPYLCPNVTRPENGTVNVCCDACEELGIAPGLNKRRYAILIFTNKVAVGDYYTVECPTGQVFKETLTRGKNFTCNKGYKYTGPGGENITYVENTCIDEVKGCGELIIDESTTIFNQTCTPFLGNPKYYPRNCTRDVKCKYEGFHPEEGKNLGFAWKSVECWYNPANKSYYWHDLFLNQPWQPYKCVNECINATEPLISENKSVVVTKENVTMVCNLTVVPYMTGDYYCDNEGDVVDASCNGTCPPLIVEDPLAIGKGPEPMVYKGLVIIGGSYHVICPEGKWYNETCNSTRIYICDDNETYTSENETGLLEAIDTCVDVDNCTCTLTVGEGVEINHKYENCPARDDPVYGISCAVQLRCKKGYYPVATGKWTQDQYCSNKEEGDEGVWWLFDPDQKAPTFGPCKEGCISEFEMKEYTTKVKETTTRNGITSVCEVEYLHKDLIDKVCDNSSIKPTGEVSRTCTNTCDQLIMGPGLTYVYVSPSFWNGLVFLWDYYTVQCPHGKVWPETKTEWKKFTCNQDRKYNTSWETGLTIAENRCVDKEEEKQGCGEIDIDSSTVIFNQTCTPFTGSPSIYPTNCTLDIKCKHKDYRPVEEKNLYFSWHSVECWYNPVQKNYYWHDLTLDTPWKPYKCVNDCINATEPMTRGNNSVIVTKENVTIVCNITTVNYKTGQYYCNTPGDGDVVDASCNGTCPPLAVEDPLIIGKGPEPLVYKNLVIIGGSYHVMCPEGKWYNETNKSTREYICGDNETYTSENETGLLEAIDTCVDVGNCTCTLTVGEGVEINHKYENCPARDNNIYGISCAVQLRCKKGYRPVGKITQDQYCSDKEEGDDGDWWLFNPDEKAPTFACKKNKEECIGQSEMMEYARKVTETRTQMGITAVCEVDYIDILLIDAICNKSSVFASGEVVGSRKCNGTCNPLEMGPGMTYIPISPEFWKGLVFWHDSYNVQCPNGKVWPETMSTAKEFFCTPKGTYSTNNETGLMIALDKCIPDNCTDTTTAPPPTTPSIPCCSDRSLPPPEGTVYYGYNCTPGNNVEGCQISYKCDHPDWYPINARDQKLLNRTAVCNGNIWIDPTTGGEFEDFLCKKGCINDTSQLPRITRIEQQVQIGDTTVCCNNTYIDGITRLYYCNYTKYLSIACTETCPALKVTQPPMSIVFYPERRVPELDLIFRGTKYTVACPAGKVFSGTKDNYRNYTCDHDGTYYTLTKGGLTAAETDCVDVPTTTPTCSLTAPPAPVQMSSDNCANVKDGNYAVSCVVYLSCSKGNHPTAVEDQAYPNRAIVCKQQTDGTVAWENIRTGKVVTDTYSCKVGCLTTAPADETIAISGMNCNVTSIPIGSIEYQCDSPQIQPSGIKKTTCSQGCKNLPYIQDYMETSGPTILYDHVTKNTNYSLYCPPGMYFDTTLTIYQTFVCLEDGTYMTSGGAKYVPGGSIGNCINPPPSSPIPQASKPDFKLGKPCNNLGGDTQQQTPNTLENVSVTGGPDPNYKAEQIAPPTIGGETGTEVDEGKGLQ